MSIPSPDPAKYRPEGTQKFHQAPIGQRCWHLFVRLSRAGKPQKPILRTGNASQPGRPCAILTGHVSTLSEHKALTGFSAYLDHRSGSGRASFLPSAVPLAHIPERGGPVPAKATGLL